MWSVRPSNVDGCIELPSPEVATFARTSGKDKAPLLLVLGARQEAGWRRRLWRVQNACHDEVVAPHDKLRPQQSLPHDKLRPQSRAPRLSRRMGQLRDLGPDHEF